MSASWLFATQGRPRCPCLLEPRVCMNGPVQHEQPERLCPTRIGSHSVAPAARGRLSFWRGPAQAPSDHRAMIGEIALVGTRPITGLSSCSRSSAACSDAFTGSVQIQHESASCTAGPDVNSTSGNRSTVRSRCPPMLVSAIKLLHSIDVSILGCSSSFANTTRQAPQGIGIPVLVGLATNWARRQVRP
jgi:hypothetical protein